MPSGGNGTAEYMPITARGAFRNLTLASVLSHHNLKRAWKATVRHGLRNQELADLHDYLDVHRRIGGVVSRLHSEVVDGAYRPREPEIVRVEKALGVSRRVVIPSPGDAILLQAIVDSVERTILSAQPSPSAFYSRSHSPPSIFGVDHTFPYPWWELWPEFQERILQFSNKYPVVVMTDVANYFDVLPLRTLRNRLVSLGKFQEELIDFLFFMLESFIWRPDYIPGSGVGLPQIQFDAPRLLAHCYLFDADEYLHRTTKGDFVRWMDDINFGASSRPQAKHLLREFDEILATLSLRLNPGKTKILTGQEVVQHLWMQENRQLTIANNTIRSAQRGGRSTRRWNKYVRSRFKSFWPASREGNWAKVLKRYFTIFERLSDSSLERIVPELLRELPEVRSSIYRYYQTLGYSPARFRQIESFIAGGHCLDDSGLFGAAKLIVDLVHSSPKPISQPCFQYREALHERTPGAGFCSLSRTLVALQVWHSIRARQLSTAHAQSLEAVRVGRAPGRSISAPSQRGRSILGTRSHSTIRSIGCVRSSRSPRRMLSTHVR